jgi:Fe-S cluster assembly ATPase SufC
VNLKQATAIFRRVVVVLPSGKVTTAPDPNASGFSTLDARFILQGEGQVTSGGVVLGNQALKIGSPIELEGASYRINGVVSNVEIANN